MTSNLTENNYFVDPNSIIKLFKSKKIGVPAPVAKPLYDLFYAKTEFDQLNIYNQLKLSKELVENKMLISLSCLEKITNQNLKTETPLGIYSIVRCTNIELDFIDFDFYLQNKEYDGSGELHRGYQHYCLSDLKLTGDSQFQLALKMKKEGHNIYRVTTSHLSYDRNLTINRESCILRIQNSVVNRDFNLEYPHLTLRSSCTDIGIPALVDFGCCSLYENYLMFKSKIPEFKLMDNLQNNYLHNSNDLNNYLDSSISDLKKQLININKSINLKDQFNSKEEELIYLRRSYKNILINN